MPILLDRRAFLATTAGFIALHPFAARAQAGQAHLRIMETTDIHVHVFPYDYYGDRPVDTVGLARTASLINGIRDKLGFDAVPVRVVLKSPKNPFQKD